jgi:arabinofuranan 3-O-arabinosyltransferase
VRPVEGAATTGAVCGFGPEIYVDGILHRTEVAGTFDALRDGDPLTLRSCDGPVGLWSGEHRIAVVPSEQFQIATLSLTPAVESDTETSPAPQPEVVKWSDSVREVRLREDSAQSSLLSVPENFNRGWSATLGGERLKALRVDGWQQGWVVPEGSSGMIRMTYEPQGPYRLLLVLGLAVAGAVLLIALVFVARPIRGPTRLVDLGSPGMTGRRASLGLVLGGALFGGAFLVVGMCAGFLRRAWAPYAGLVLVVGAGVLSAMAREQVWLNVAAALCAAGVGAFAGTLMANPFARGSKSE